MPKKHNVAREHFLNESTEATYVDNIGAESVNATTDLVANGNYVVSSDISVDKEGNITADTRPSKVIRRALKLVRQHNNASQVLLAEAILRRIEKTLKSFQTLKLPDIHVSSVDQVVLGLVWKIQDTLIGFNLDPNINESSWFILIGEKDGVLRADGEINKLDDGIFDNLLRSILSKVTEGGTVAKALPR